MGDRSGGREPKGASLKKSKKNPGSTVAKAKTKVKDTEQIIKSSSTLPPPPLANLGKYFDSSCALLSRQFDRDRDRVIQRAMTDGVSGILVWFSDVEKQSSIIDHCKNSIGHCYAAVGISPDNIDRTNKKMHSGWLLKIEELALSAECVAIITGLNLTKEMGTHFPQESLLKACAEVASRLALPLILHVGGDGASLDRAFEILHELEWLGESGIQPDRTIILYDALSACSGDLQRVQNVVRNGFYCMISAAGITDPIIEIQTTFQSCLKAIPLDQIIACTDSPWKTPQNLSDVYLRTLRNEPCNMFSVIDAIASGLELPRETVSETILQTTMKVFQIPSLSSESKSETEIETETETATSSTPAFLSPMEPRIQSEVHENLKESSTSPGENLKSELTKNESTRYHCAKCRRLIATSTNVVTHSLGASKTVFKIGQEGLCNSSIFIPYFPNDKSEQQNGYTIEKENVHCVGCHAKFGRVSFGDATCGCGATVSGPVLKINAAKLDQFLQDTDPLDTSQLSAILSRMEDQLGDDEDQNGGNKSKSKKKKKGKQQKSDNKGNFSSYRNKSFVPNASRKKNVNANVDDDGNDDEEEDHDDEDAVEESEERSGGDQQEATSTNIALLDDEDDEGGEGEDAENKDEEG